MTYRQRREARAERLRSWADKRETKSSARLGAANQLADSIPLGQPILVGHHSERHARKDVERIHSGLRAGFEHANKAAAFRSKADNIEAAAERAIYSDDPDAPERLRERIAELEAERARIKAYNATCRKAAKAGGLGDRTLLDDKQRKDLLVIARVASFQLGAGAAFPAYVSTNLGGNIARLKKRLEHVETNAAQRARCDAALAAEAEEAAQ